MITLSKTIMMMIILVLVELFLALQTTLLVLCTMMRMILMTSDEGDINGVLTMLGDVT